MFLLGINELILNDDENDECEHGCVVVWVNGSVLSPM